MEVNLAPLSPRASSRFNMSNLPLASIEEEEVPNTIPVQPLLNDLTQISAISTFT